MKKIYHKIETIDGNLITLNAHRVALGELVRVHQRDKTISIGHVIAVRGMLVSIHMIGAFGLSSDDQVEFLGHGIKLTQNKELLLGRVFDSNAEPIDERPSLCSTDKTYVGGQAFNPLRRVRPSELITTGHPMIDLVNPLHVGQSLALFTTPSESHRELLMRIITNSCADVIVFGALGMKQDDVLWFKEELAKWRHQTVSFTHSAASAVTDCVAIPGFVFDVAEHFALQKKRVLVVLSDLAVFCDALKEISLGLNELPSYRGYPHGLHRMLAGPLEKAARLNAMGSITILTTASIPHGDRSHPIATTISSLTDNQIYLHESGVEPARFACSPSPLLRGDHLHLSHALRKLYVQAIQVRKQHGLGFSLSDDDEKIRHFADEFEETFMSSAIDMPIAEQLALGWRLLSNYIDKQALNIERHVIDHFWPTTVGAQDLEDERIPV